MKTKKPKQEKFHPLTSRPGRTAAPQRFNNPFHYQPHALTLAAAAELQRYLSNQTAWQEELDRGKMFGVLVVRRGRQLGFIAAFSGLLGERSLWPYFVPPIYDSQQPQGHFKQEEAAISALNRRISQLEQAPERQELLLKQQLVTKEAERLIQSFKQEMAEAKARRDSRKAHATENERQEMIRESQFMKAELGRKKKQTRMEIESIGQQMEMLNSEIDKLKQERKQRSDTLQRWLFEQYRVINARGEERPLTDIFEEHSHRLPPSGAGDCCAPRLLQYAYTHQLKPICMGEFWWGSSPKAEVRHHLQYYTACRGKCLPILQFMLQGLEVDDYALDRDEQQALDIAYEDEWLCVVKKPSGMLSVPGRSERRSVAGLLQQAWQGRWQVLPAHRLDMHTSGLMVVAKDKQTYQALQRQFANHQVKKRYVAVLEGVWQGNKKGTIQLPLRPDPVDRPRQVVDPDQGKNAITSYQVMRTSKSRTLIALHPHTGRTHQLRLHCAHQEGLALPIAGDALYGHAASAPRLMLHAEALQFTHPHTGKTMRLEWRHPFDLRTIQTHHKH